MEYFSVLADEIEGRIDPFYYKPEFVELYKKLSKIKLVSFGEIITSIINGFDYRKFSDEGLTYLRVSNIKPFEFDLTEVKKINPNFTINKNIKLKKGDLLLTRKGTFGVALILEKDEDYIISSEIFKIELTKDINPRFIEIILNSNIGQKQFDKYKIGAIMGSLSQEAVKKIKIPLPLIKTQNKIVKLMDNTYKIKKQKETKAQQLLDSINDYVLDESKIKLPELKRHLTYLVFSDETREERLDPRYYKPYFKEFEAELTKKKDIKTIGEISEYVGSGATPKSGGDDYTSREEGISFIRIVNLKNNTVVLDDVLYIKKEIHEGMLKRTQLKPNDVLLSMAGTIGLSVVVPENLGEANINQAIARIIVGDNINPFYLSALLNSKIGRIQTDRLSRPAVQTNINLEEIRALKIPLPPLAVQNKIAKEVKKRAQKTEQLQKEAKEELEKAKQEVEKMILREWKAPAPPGENLMTENKKKLRQQ